MFTSASEDGEIAFDFQHQTRVRQPQPIAHCAMQKRSSQQRSRE